MTLKNLYWLKRFFVYKEKNKKLIIMIRFTWFGLVCCGVASGLVFNYVSSHEKYICMMVLAMVCFILVTIHKLATDKLCSEDLDYDEYHAPIFRYSAIISILIAIISAFFGLEPLSFGSVFSGIAFIFAAFQESKYT